MSGTRLKQELKTIEWESIDNVTHIFGKYIIERAGDRPFIEFGNEIKYGRKRRSVIMRVERDMPPDQVISYSEVVTAEQFQRADTIAKFCVKAKDFFDRAEFLNRSQLN